MNDITIRSSRPADAPALSLLAELDSKRLPAGDMYVAEVGGQLVAAFSPETRQSIADPFRRTAGVIDLLRTAADPRAAASKTRFRGLFALPRPA